MKKEIVVAGAGHGGIVCAALLAEKGFDVTVYEKDDRAGSGHDWTDSFPLCAFIESDIPLPPKTKYTPSHATCYVNPNKSVLIPMPENTDPETATFTFDRKYLLHYLIRYAEKKGVKFRFNTEVVCPICDGKRVLGLIVRRGGRLYSVYASLVIDAAGVNSPVRTLLPPKMGIMNEFDGDQIFTAYRAFFERVPGAPPEHDYMVHLFHMHEPGLSWLISEDSYCDVLVGRFGSSISEEDIEEALDDLRKTYPIIGKNVLRGGEVAQIPIRRTIPLIVADGYAVIGDSACMTIPIIGSGVANSMRAGKYLADAVIEDKECKFTSETLWKYQYDYFMNIGNSLVALDKLREVLGKLSGEDVDFLLEKNIITENELSITNGGAEITVLGIAQKLIKALPKFPMLANITRALAKRGFIKKVLSETPEKYDKDAVENWAGRYELL